MTKRGNSRSAFARNCSALVLGGAALPFMAVSALAQETPDAGSSGDDEIVVTARSRAENLLQVPDSVTVLSASTIENAGVRGLNEVSALTSNLNYMNYEQPGVVAVSLRGVSQLRIGQAPVAFVVDGVTVYNPQEFSQEMFDVQQIEVLKGPQGALYGINSIGGAINITTRAPSNEFEGVARVGAAEGNERRGFVRISGPLVEDRVLFSASANFRTTDGLLDDIYGRDIDFADEVGVRGRLLLNFNDRLSADLRANYTNLDAGALYFAPEQEVFPGDGTIVGEVNADLLGRSSREVGGASAKITYEADFGRIDFINAWTQLTSDADQDGDTSALSAMEFYANNDTETLVHELRLTSHDDERLRWIVGGLVMNFERDTETGVYLNLNGPMFGGPGVPADKSLILAAQLADALENEIYAVFGQVNYDLTDALELTLALRYDADSATIDRGALVESETFSAWQPKVSLSYDLTDDVMVYGTYSEGFRSGGFNTVDVFGARYEQEGTQNYEVGVKSRLWGGRGALSVAAFRTEYENQQIFVFDLGTASQNLVNAPSSEISGFEVELSARPFEGFDLNMSYGYLDTTINSFPDLPSASIDTSAIPGRHIPLNSEYTFNVSAQYTAPLGGAWSAFGRVDFERRGPMYWQADNLDVQEAFNLVNFRLGVERGDFTAALYVNNASDEEYLENYFPGEWIGFIDMSYPSNHRRQVGFEASYHF